MGGGVHLVPRVIFWIYLGGGGGVAHPEYLSRISDPDFFPSRIPDPTKKEEGKNKLVVLPFLIAFPSIH